MYRLLVVDDEEIITDGLYEFFIRWMPEKLDVCRAYSGKEALAWMARTRIDIVLTDIRMPGMNGLELTENIQSCWPRCRIIFLTGYSEFDYAYKAIQMSDVRYLLKTEGYDKVMETVQSVMYEIERGNEMSEMLEQSRGHLKTLEYMGQSDYFRQYLKDSKLHAANREQLSEELGRLNITLDAGLPVVLALGRISYPANMDYTEKNRKLNEARLIWHSFMDDQSRSVGITDQYGDLLWLIQPEIAAGDTSVNRLVVYLEGTLELIQEACRKSLGLNVTFTISGQPCDWSMVASQYEKLRQMQQLKIGDGISMIVKDRSAGAETAPGKELIAVSRIAGILDAHLEAGREQEFLKELEQLSLSLVKGDSHPGNAAEAYYSIALQLLSHMNRLGLPDQEGENGKLLKLDEHVSILEAFRYLYRIAESIFAFKRLDDRDKTTHAIDRVCQFIESNLGDDVSLVRLAEVHYFNPSYLSRLFKQERGINLSEYIDKCRIRKAKGLLKDSDLKVREIAILVGYDAAHSFTRFFKKSTGLTPQEYRDSLSG